MQKIKKHQHFYTFPLTKGIVKYRVLEQNIQKLIYIIRNNRGNSSIHVGRVFLRNDQSLEDPQAPIAGLLSRSHGNTRPIRTNLKRITNVPSIIQVHLSMVSILSVIIYTALHNLHILCKKNDK